MKLWVDAEREPDVDWVWSKTEASAIAFLKGGNVELISLAPDQPELVGLVTDWMNDNDAHPEREAHDTTGGVKNPRGFLQLISRAASL